MRKMEFSPVLLYSKYSRSCSKLMEIIQAGPGDFSFLQFLCIDNEQFRKRIKSNNPLQITTVPCILMFNKGAIEKYEGTQAFSWINAFVTSAQEEIDARREEERKIQLMREKELEEKERLEAQAQEEEERQETEQERHLRELEENSRSAKEKAHHSRDLKPRDSRDSRSKKDGIKEPQRKTMLDSIDEDVEIEDDREDDREDENQEEFDQKSSRVMNPPAPKRMIKDRGNYEDDDELYSGEAVDHRRAPKVIRADSSQDSAKDPHGTLAKMEQMKREREAIDAQLAAPSKRPIDARRP